MFIDEKKLRVRSGKGGDGITSWIRAKRIPRGGPGGGDGGKGGDVVLVADVQLTTFGDMEAIHVARAKDGERGGKNKRAGANGADRVVRVPVGTTVYDDDGGLLLVDHGRGRPERYRSPRAEAGGGSETRASRPPPTRPRRSARPGVEGRQDPQAAAASCRLLADVGLIGLPNAGKSTLLVAPVGTRRRSIADYPFTTLAPHLGIVERPDFTRFVIADLPGLIEGRPATGTGPGGPLPAPRGAHARAGPPRRSRLPRDGSGPDRELPHDPRGARAAYGRGLARAARDRGSPRRPMCWPPDSPPRLRP